MPVNQSLFTSCSHRYERCPKHPGEKKTFTPPVYRQVRTKSAPGRNPCFLPSCYPNRYIHPASSSYHIRIYLRLWSYRPKTNKLYANAHSPFQHFLPVSLFLFISPTQCVNIPDLFIIITIINDCKKKQFTHTIIQHHHACWDSIEAVTFMPSATSSSSFFRKASTNFYQTFSQFFIWFHKKRTSYLESSNSSPIVEFGTVLKSQIIGFTYRFIFSVL